MDVMFSKKAQLGHCLRDVWEIHDIHHLKNICLFLTRDGDGTRGVL